MKFPELHLNKIFFYGAATLWTWLVFVFLVTGNTFYEVSDNLQLEWLISGSYGKSIYDFPRFFQLFGYPLQVLYKLFPNFSWMGFLFILLNYISGLSLLWCLVERTKIFHFRIRLALLLLLAGFLTDFILYLDFTRSALLMGMAGIFLFFCSEKYWAKALALTFIIAAIGLRFMVIYFIGFMSIVWLFYEFQLNRILVTYFGVLFLCFLSFGLPQKQFAEFIELNKAKTVFNDYGVKESNNKNCFGGWFFLDENTNQKIITQSKSHGLFSRFSTEKLYGAIREAKGEIQWVVFVLLIAVLTKQYKVLILYFLGFLGLVIFLKFSVKVWVVYSMFLALVALFNAEKKLEHNFFNLKGLVFLMVLLVALSFKISKRIDFSREINEQHTAIIKQLNSLAGNKVVYLINPYDFKRYVNPFSLKQTSLKNVISLTGWQTIHPKYKEVINQSLQLNHEFSLENVAKKLKGNYVILGKGEQSQFKKCVKSTLNLDLTVVNQEQLTDTVYSNERLKLFYVR